MISEPRVAYTIKPANRFLWAVKSYIELITRDEPLTYGIGLKRLYSLMNGADTLNDADLIGITQKAEKLGLIPNNLYYFMMACIAKNCKIYGTELAKMITDRIIEIANGEITNPETTLKFSPTDDRRNFYLPPITLIKRIQKAIISDTYASRINGQMPPLSIGDVAAEANLTLARMQGTQGTIAPNESSYGAINRVVKDLIYVLETESNYPIEDRDYRVRARAALSVLWVIAKLLYGDLTVTPQRKDINLVDLDSKINIKDGTLASIPFPSRQTVDVFCDEGPGGVTVRGRLYLSAVSAAAFYRSSRN